MAAKPDGAEPGPTTGGAETAELTYEQARDELVAIVGWLEAGGVTLEESLALWQRGRISPLCASVISDSARERLDTATGAADTPSP